MHRQSVHVVAYKDSTPAVADRQQTGTERSNRGPDWQQRQQHDGTAETEPAAAGAKQKFQWTKYWYPIAQVGYKANVHPSVLVQTSTPVTSTQHSIAVPCTSSSSLARGDGHGGVFYAAAAATACIR